MSSICQMPTEPSDSYRVLGELLKNRRVDDWTERKSHFIDGNRKGLLRLNHLPKSVPVCRESLSAIYCWESNLQINLGGIKLARLRCIVVAQEARLRANTNRDSFINVCAAQKGANAVLRMVRMNCSMVNFLRRR